jgi:preprotein translocase subunit SecD
MFGRNPKYSRKAGSSGLFRYVTFATAFLLAIARTATAEPLAIEIVDAQVGYDQRTGEPIISFKMSDASGKLFAALTQANIGRKFALRIDGQSVSEPVIREPIFGGAGQISGHFTVQQARDTAARLLSGRSKLEMEIVP